MLKYALVALVAVTASFSATVAKAETAGKTIVEIAAGAEDFSTLVAAVKAAELVDVLSSKGPFTVFAPTNEAFAKLPKGTVESLLKPENKDKLIAVLK
ncbi:MAG: fasciclin domain-containing protein, partial [Planctomycetota bacterium]|nr:fasciclin domain-containing protein [Planctomycetota bacterium]